MFNERTDAFMTWSLNKLPKVLTALLIVILIANVSVQYTITQNQIYTSYKGFAVDSHGNLYLGVSSKIMAVDSNGLERYSFSAITKRGYSFTINKEDQVIIRSGEYVWITDLNGNVIEEHIGTEIADRLLPYGNSTRSFTDSEGRIYQMKSRFFRVEIYKYEKGEESLIYQMPWLNYVMKLALEGTSLCFLILIPLIIVKVWKPDSNELWHKHTWRIT